MGLSIKFGSFIIWGLKKILFKHDWVDDSFNIDELRFTVVNLDQKGCKSDYFILASHAK